MIWNNNVESAKSVILNLDFGPLTIVLPCLWLIALIRRHLCCETEAHISVWNEKGYVRLPQEEHVGSWYRVPLLPRGYHVYADHLCATLGSMSEGRSKTRLGETSPICGMNLYSCFAPTQGLVYSTYISRNLAPTFLLGRGNTALIANMKLRRGALSSLCKLCSRPAFDFDCWRDTTLITKIQRSHGCERTYHCISSSNIKRISELI